MAKAWIRYAYPLKYKVANDPTCGSERGWMRKNGLLPKNTFFTCYDEAYGNEADELIKVMGLK